MAKYITTTATYEEYRLTQLEAAIHRAIYYSASLGKSDAVAIALLAARACESHLIEKGILCNAAIAQDANTTKTDV